MRRYQHITPELPNYYAYRLQMNGVDLDWQQKAHFIWCTNRIYQESEHVIFRGDKKDSLKRAYRISGPWSPVTFSGELFFFGPKSRLFTLSATQRQRALNITRSCNDDFSRIFRMIRELIRTSDLSELRENIEKLTRESGPLVTYFLQADNEVKFLEAARSLPEALRLQIRDYYLSLLHHIGTGVYYDETFMLSTTESFTKARKFAFGNKSRSALPMSSEEAIVIAGWVPKGLGNVIRTSPFINSRNHRKIEQSGLPFYRPLFPHEKEITLKGGLLPHHILGYLHWIGREEVFEVNPALFFVDENWDGIQLPVDQSSWEARILNTEFGAYFSVYDSQTFSQHEINKM